MRVSAPLKKSTRSIAADWVEIQALLHEAGSNEQALIRSQSVQSEPDHGELITDIDSEPVDEEILEPEMEALSERVYQELAHRENVLGTLYPFELSSEYGKWTLTRRDTESDAAKAAHDCYLCCLLITAIHSELLPLKNEDELFISSAEAMQIQAYLTAAEILGGRAYWFGSPRPTGDGMLAAVQDLVEKMGTGIAPDDRPLGLSANAADGTVDIVAWRPFLDGQPASVVAYGQVASGRNWKGKPIKAFIDGHFLPWFIKPPSHKHIELLFIPKLQHHELKEDKTHDFAVIAREQASLLEKDFGVVIDRLRLTELAGLAKNSQRYDEAEYDKHQVTARTWTDAAVEYAGGGK